MHAACSCLRPSSGERFECPGEADLHAPAVGVAGRWWNQPRPGPLLRPGLPIPGQPRTPTRAPPWKASSGQALCCTPERPPGRDPRRRDGLRGRHEHLRLASDLSDAHAAWWKPYIASSGGGTA